MVRLRMFYLGRFLQVVGFGLAGIGCIKGFDADTTERVMWTFCLAGLMVFYLGHWIIPKK